MKDCPSLLLVEDDENDRLFIRRGLDKAGVGDRLRVACDGDEAVAYLEGRGAYGDRKENPIPALIILDLKLPKRSGLEGWGCARAGRGSKDIPASSPRPPRNPRTSSGPANFASSPITSSRRTS